MIKLQHPLPGARKTDGFGWRAAIPGVAAAQLHNGQDFAAAAGTPIRAAHAGTVRAIWWDTFPGGAPAGGHMVKIGTATYSTLYAHMLHASPLKLGQSVRAGDVIGYVGSSGASTGPHLHFMLELPGGYVDPMPYINSTPAPARKDTDPMPKTIRGKHRPKTPQKLPAGKWTYLHINEKKWITPLHGGGGKGRHALVFCNLDVRGKVDVRALVERTNKDGSKVLESRHTYYQRVDRLGTYALPVEVPANWRLRFQARPIDSVTLEVVQTGYIIDYWDK